MKRIMLLVLLVLMVPVKIGAFSPAFPDSGIRVYLEAIDAQSVYYIDILYEYNDDLYDYTNEEVETVFHHPTPNSIYENEYANRDNDYLSATLFFKDYYPEYGDYYLIAEEYNFSHEKYPFDHFRIAVYRDNALLMVSGAYDSSKFPTYDDPVGYQIIFKADEELFYLRSFEGTVESSSAGIDFITYLIIIFYGIFGFIYTLLEPGLYLIFRKGKEVSLYTLAFNMIVFLSVVIMIQFPYNSSVLMLLGFLFVPLIIVLKLIVVRRLYPGLERASFAFSIFNYAIVFISTIVTI
jgi:hypothetical protein